VTWQSKTVVDGETMGALLRAYRHTAKLTMEELAEASGVSARAISDMERGYSRRPQRRTLKAIIDALGLAPDDERALLTARETPAAHAAGYCELPRDVTDFTGRTAELAWLEALGRRASMTRPAVIAVVTAPAGLGKTALATHTAGLLGEQFPDGRFFVDLQGMDPEPLDPAEALTQLLRALGVAERRISADEAERAQLYRGTLRGRRCLIVLDNAASEAQVRPLLPAESASMVLITSRRPLAGLEDVHRLPLAPLSGPESADLLAAIIGKGRAAAESAAVTRIGELCGKLPLALRIAGNRLLSRPGWTVQHLAVRLGDEERRLANLAVGDLHVETAFALSYQQLTPPARTLFRRLSLVPGPDSGVHLAAALTGSSVADAEDLLEELVELGLLQSAFDERYRFHDLVRLFAAQRLSEEEPPADREAARHRMIDWLLEVATVAGRWFHLEFGPPPAGWSNLITLPTTESAMAWLRAESQNWFAAFQSDAAQGDHARVIDVAEAMHWFSEHWTYWGHWHEVYALSSAAAHDLGDRGLEAIHLNYLAWAYSACLSRYPDAIEAADRALAIAADSGDVRQQAWAHYLIAVARLRLAEYACAEPHAREALACMEAAGDREGYPQALGALGDTLRGLGRLDEALDYHLRCVTLLRGPDHGTDPGIAESVLGLSLIRLGQTYTAMGNWREAAERFEESARLLGQHDMRRFEGEALIGSASALRKLGRESDARARLAEALRIFEDMGEEESADTVRAELLALTVTGKPQCSQFADTAE
jgi:transcriptional regulator with XRE-family HTH domain/tetratricopeptide (TPR) repeat protein